MTEQGRRRFHLRGRTLRQHTARGVLVNSAFVVGLSVLGFLKGFAVAAFVARSDYGVWGILMISLGTLLWLKQFGVGDKFVQQDEDDQEAEFQYAFTLEVATTVAMVVLLGAALPILCVIYDEWLLLAPGLVYILLIMPAGVLRAPLWVFYREMRFVRQRALQAVEPIVAFVVSIALAIAGLGYWALIIGLLAGTWASSALSVWFSPYRFRLRFGRVKLRGYWQFSWPLLVMSGTSMVIAQSAVIASDAHLGLAGVGAVALAANITELTNRVDGLVTGTLYPAICAVKDRVDLLYESFVKSNRLALMWAVPFGIGLALFAMDLIDFGIGERWRPAATLLQIYGLVAAYGHIGFNWDAYFRARGETKPMAVASTAAMVAFLATGIPLLFVYDLRGLAIGVAVQAAVHVAVRAYYLKRLFDGFSFLRHALRAALPTVPAALVVLLLRVAEPFDRSLAVALGELLVYAAVTVAATWWFERKLVREVLGYLSPRFAAAKAA